MKGRAAATSLLIHLSTKHRSSQRKARLRTATRTLFCRPLAAPFFPPAVARDLVLSRRDKQRSQRVVEAQVVGPFVAWGAVAGVIYGVTWALQSSTAAVFEPSRAGYFMRTYTAKCLCSATDLVVDTVNRLNGSPWATASGSVK